MKTLVEADYVQAVWLGTASRYGHSDELVGGLIAAIDRLDDRAVNTALVDTCRMDLAVERLGTAPCSCVDELPENDLARCPTLAPALAEAGRAMMRQACDSIRRWNVLAVNGGWVAAGVADDNHYDGTILIGQIDPLAGT
ncbi:hypothetical protein M3C36_06540 [Dietzia cinnamea]|nr:MULTISPECIES: hypothetical protein [Dietzia]AVM66157.1 hypothetical protein C3V38_16505 [Dietzia sp. oral taxon 368]MCT1884844.1 hypothetical protein [Dietzia cinnamea]